MKTLLLFVSLLFSGASFAQQNHYPVIVSGGEGVSDFVPAGWQIIDSVAYGDLNKDGLKDAAFVIQFKDTLTEWMYNFETQKYDIEEQSTPRILVILFQHKDGWFHLAAQNNDFILRFDEGGAFGEPFNGLEIKNGALSISFYGGSRERWGAKYIFRFQDNDWFLIGATSEVRDANLGDSEYSDYNFSTKKMKQTSERYYLNSPNERDKPEVKTEWKSIKIGELKTFKTFIRPFTWKMEDGTLL